MVWNAENPWRCWERTTLAGVLNGPDGLLVRVAMENRQRGAYQCEFRWPALVRIGPNDFHGRYAQVLLRFEEVVWSFEVANVGPRTLLCVRPADPAAARGVRLRLETLYADPRAGAIVTREENVFAVGDERTWRVASLSPTAQRVGSSIVAPLERPFFATIEPAGREAAYRLEQRDVHERRAADPTTPLTEAEREAARQLRTARAEFLARFDRVPAELWWMYAAIPYAIGWNIIWAAERREPVNVSSRDWCVHGNYGQWVLFNWDTFLLVPAAAEYDVELAHQMVRPEFDVQTPEGLIPGIYCTLGYTADRAMPPVASLACYKAYQRSGDERFVRDYYEPLTRYHEWFRRNRDVAGDGLLAWGSNPAKVAHPQWHAHSHWAARYEAGMDNHPMWDDVPFDERTHTLRQYDVGLTALHALDARILAQMARMLGASDDAERFEQRAAQVTRQIEARLWDDATGLWLSRNFDGRFCPRAAPTCFYPIALDVDRGHVERAIREHLFEPRRFGGRYGLSVCPKDDPAYDEQYYVRGRIWPPQTYLTHVALREAGREDDAARLARVVVGTMRQEWLDEGHLHETLNAETADGDDTAESDPLYSFGILLPLVGWSQLHDWTIDGRELRHGPELLADFHDRDGVLRRRIEPLECWPEL